MYVGHTHFCTCHECDKLMNCHFCDRLPLNDIIIMREIPLSTCHICVLISAHYLLFVSYYHEESNEYEVVN